jgi:hypothetical protein
MMPPLVYTLHLIQIVYPAWQNYTLEVHSRGSCVNPRHVSHGYVDYFMFYAVVQLTA